MNEYIEKRKKSPLLDFDSQKVFFAIRVSVAVCLAYFIAWKFGFENAQWAGMTAWTCSQPTRGQLIEKGLCRFLGTVFGVIYGMYLVWAFQLQPLYLVIGLALWVGACAAFAFVRRGYWSHAGHVAGFSAPMVALMDFPHSQHVVILGLDRLGTVLVGAVIAFVIGFFFSPHMDRARLRAKGGSLLRPVFEVLRKKIETGHVDQSEFDGVLRKIVALESEYDSFAAGSMKSQTAVKATRALMNSLFVLLFWVKRDVIKRENIGEATKEIDNILSSVDVDNDDFTRTHLKKLIRVKGLDSDLKLLLNNLLQSLNVWKSDSNLVKKLILPVKIHRDWRGAKEAGIRSFLSILIFGIIWYLTRSSTVALVILGLSVMVTVFSRVDNPAYTINFVFGGQFLGAVGAVLCANLLWVHATSALQVVLMVFPFVFLGVLIYGNRRISPFGFDYYMVLMLVSKPVFPVVATWQTSLMSGFAVVAAPLAAMILFRILFPTDLHYRLRGIIRSMVVDLGEARETNFNLETVRKWRALLYDRSIQLLTVSYKLDDSLHDALNASFAIHEMCECVILCNRYLKKKEISEELRAAIEYYFFNLPQICHEASYVEHALVQLAEVVEPRYRPLFLRARNLLVSNEELFKRDWKKKKRNSKMLLAA